jgi:hypothetical protein
MVKFIYMALIPPREVLNQLYVTAYLITRIFRINRSRPEPVKQPAERFFKNPSDFFLLRVIDEQRSIGYDNRLGLIKTAQESDQISVSELLNWRATCNALCCP